MVETYLKICGKNEKFNINWQNLPPPFFVDAFAQKITFYLNLAKRKESCKIRHPLFDTS